jgi:uncharacterized protein (TIGR00266 family)
METRILGTTMPVLEITLTPGDTLIAESGELSWLSSSIALRTSTQLGGAKGIFGVIKRVVGGGTLFMTEYTAEGQPGFVAFATKVPGEILPIDVRPGQSYMVHRTGFMCATSTVEISMGFQRRLGAGIFGGEGFIMQRLTGSGQAWVELDGEVVTYDLRPGEQLRVQPGHIGMFEESVTFDIQMVRGVKNMLFGGEGLFLATVTGPGRVWLQSLPLSNLALALSPYLGKDGNAVGNVAAGGIAGAALGGLFGGGGDD